MKLVKIDIDQLLEVTSFVSALEEDSVCNLKEIEIDMLLAITKDW